MDSGHAVRSSLEPEKSADNFLLSSYSSSVNVRAETPGWKRARALESNDKLVCESQGVATHSQHNTDVYALD